MTQATEFPAGSVVAFSSGEYSDYSIGAFSKVLKPINEAVWNAMRAACKGTDWDPDRFDDGKAVPWLVANGYIEEIEYQELHLGDYGRCPDWGNA